ncbi:D-amino-acid oxidase [Pseudohyphozyma bogoriensis]|nr:D-amino-acid oxidase [Pseudohyphozyma bogoriensis]
MSERGLRVVVLGGGVIGLTSALVLARNGYKVHLVARDMPGDKDSQGFASPWAGANWCPFGKVHRICEWEKETFSGAQGELDTFTVPIAVLTVIATFQYTRLPQSECPPNSVGVKFDTLSINSPVYILWLKSLLEELGVTFERRQIASLDAAFACFGGVGCVVNATGLGAKSLIGVLDQNVQPIRGQTVLIKSATTQCWMDFHDDKAPAYIIPRPGGEAICGGCFEVDDYNTQVDFGLAENILQRCLALDPSISTDGTIAGIEILK